MSELLSQIQEVLRIQKTCCLRRFWPEESPGECVCYELKDHIGECRCHCGTEWLFDEGYNQWDEE